MTERSRIKQCGHVDYVWRAAACLGAIGYSPHEVQGLLAAEFCVDPSLVADVLRQGSAGLVPTAR
jgi:hypothetical protein